MEFIFEAIWENGWKATLLILVVLLIRAFLLKLPKKYIYSLWMIVLLRLVCLYSFESSFSAWNIFNEKVSSNQFVNQKESDHSIINTNSSDYIENWETNELISSENEINNFGSYSETNSNVNKENEITVNDENNKFDNNKYNNAKIENTKNESIQVQNAKITDFLMNQKRIFSLIWMTGVVLFAVVFTVRMLSIKHKVDKAILLKENIYECDNIPSPFVYGLFRPRIMIPFRLEKEQRNVILEHEKYHITHKDQWVRFIWMFILCLYWFQPFVWIAFRIMIKDMEMRCDEHVLRDSTMLQKQQYSTYLLAFATNQRMDVFQMKFGENSVKERIKNIMNKKMNHKYFYILMTGIFCMLGLVCCTDAKNSLTDVNNEQDIISQENSDIENNNYSFLPIENKEQQISENADNADETSVLVKNDKGTDTFEIDYVDQSMSDKRICSNQLGQTAELIYNKRDYSCWDLMLYSEDICNPKTISLVNIYFSSVIDFDFLNENQKIVIIGHYSPNLSICVIFDIITESFETYYATEFIVNHDINKIYYVNESSQFDNFTEVGELSGEVFYQSELDADETINISMANKVWEKVRKIFPQLILDELKCLSTSEGDDNNYVGISDSLDPDKRTIRLDFVFENDDLKQFVCKDYGYSERLEIDRLAISNESEIESSLRDFCREFLNEEDFEILPYSEHNENDSFILNQDNEQQKAFQIRKEIPSDRYEEGTVDTFRDNYGGYFVVDKALRMVIFYDKTETN